MWKSTKKWLFIGALIGAVIMGFLMTASPIGQPKLLKCGDGSGMLDMRMFYSLQEAKTTLTSLDADGISVYTIIECIDYAFIVCFMLCRACFRFWHIVLEHRKDYSNYIGSHMVEVHLM